MRKGVSCLLIGAVALIGATYTILSIDYVQQGEVGVVWTAKSGVREATLEPGWHFVGPLAKVKNYPVSQQQIVFSNNPEDYGKKEHADWHIDAPADGGMVKLNMTVNYNFLNEKVTALYARFNGMDGESIVEEWYKTLSLLMSKRLLRGFRLWTSIPISGQRWQPQLRTI
ncbi:MAG: SPFH domain-containing protein [Enterocloster bolteae]